ncbi:hypothetical protein LJD41_26360, partial [Escherichia coli]|nr:hypothetical protein [Escherichia coli]
QPIAVSVNRTSGTALEYPERISFSTVPGGTGFTVPTNGTRGHEQLVRFGAPGLAVKHNNTGPAVNQWSYSSGWTI